MLVQDKQHPFCHQGRIPLFCQTSTTAFLWKVHWEPLVMEVARQRVSMMYP